VPKGESPAGYPDAVPEVAVEVRSPTDRWPKVLAKVSEYLNAGVDLVYVVDVQSQTIIAYNADQPGMRLGLDAEMTFRPPLEALRIAVRDVFQP
jgi:Uma2 family endonuclease